MIFGSDGFRSKFGEKYLTYKNIISFAYAVSQSDLLKKNLPVLIGRDTRDTGIIIENIITSALNYLGVNTVTAGIVPSPCMSSLLKQSKYSLGIMITASHNPSEDNGIKLFSSKGLKIDKKIENVLEKKIISQKYIKELVFKKNGINKIIADPYTKYCNILIKAFDFKEPNAKLLIDCSNGAFSNLIKYKFKKYKNFKIINDKSNGKNINKNVGALHAKSIIRTLKINNYDFGVSFDGDGDRAIFTSKKYGVIETEKLIYLFNKFNLSSKIVVSSEICNLALSGNLDKIGKKLIETEVGDRNVIDKVRETKCDLGAEPSGHFYFSKSANTMDGLAAMLCFVQLINIKKIDLNKMIRQVVHYPRIEKNYSANKLTRNKLKIIKWKIDSLINHKNEKFIIRKSMWDPVIRVYYDYSAKNNFLTYQKIIKDNLK